MAFVEAPDQPFGLSFTLVDSGVNQTTKTYALQGADLTAAALNANQFLAKFAAVTKANIKGYTLMQHFINDAFSVPVNGCEIENRADILVTLTTSPLKTGRIQIPAPIDAIMVGAPGTKNYNVVDLADPLLVDLFLSFNLNGDVFLSDGELMSVGGQLEGKRVHRASRKG